MMSYLKYFRRYFRTSAGHLLGLQSDLRIWWTPEIPLIYIANPKAGCSTIMQSMKAAQAAVYERDGRPFRRVEDPHTVDDCLYHDGLMPRQAKQRYVFSCVRNPFARALSAYLDKIVTGAKTGRMEFRSRSVNTFEDFLRAIGDANPMHIDTHFRPQYLNLNYPKIAYDALFYLEDDRPMADFLARIHPGFSLHRWSPHARSAADKLRTHYNDTTLDLARRFYARDFEYFGYSLELEDALKAPAAMIVEEKLMLDSGNRVPTPPRQAPHSVLGATLRFRRLVHMRIF